ncbi:MAG: hypothetical protein ACT6R6_01010 [Flavobacterium sp.]
MAILSCLLFTAVNAQDDRDFWSRVRFGGGFGLGIGSGYTDITIAPGAIYQFNDYVALGVGVEGTYINQDNFYKAWLYGGSVVGLFNPIEEIQLSAELEQLRVNQEFDRDYFDPLVDGGGTSRHRDFWNTALFLGAGYRMDYVTIGVRYNVLYDEDDMVYSNSWMPFVRVYF